MSMYDTFRVNSEFDDPVEGEISLAIYNGNPFYGYYGYGRDNGDKEHRGYDYVAIEGETKVIAVEDGDMVMVRFGHPINTRYPLDSCIHRNNVSANSKYSSGACSDCKNIGGCYGIQVWLRIKKSSLYAFYAHLSELSEDILSKMPSTVMGDVRINMTVKKGKPIGICGRTGIASEKSKDNNLNIYNGFRWPQHLHFECRKGIRKGNEVTIPETGDQISPNNIVKTQFLITKDLKSVFEENVDTEKWSTINGKLQKDWNNIFVDTDRKPSRPIVFLAHAVIP